MPAPLPQGSNGGALTTAASPHETCDGDGEREAQGAERAAPPERPEAGEVAQPMEEVRGAGSPGLLASLPAPPTQPAALRALALSALLLLLPLRAAPIKNWHHQRTHRCSRPNPSTCHRLQDEGMEYDRQEEDLEDEDEEGEEGAGRSRAGTTRGGGGSGLARMAIDAPGARCRLQVGRGGADRRGGAGRRLACAALRLAQAWAEGYVLRWGRLAARSAANVRPLSCSLRLLPLVLLC